MENEQYEQQMGWEADQNAEGEAMAAQAEAEMEQAKAMEEMEITNCISFLEKRGYKVTLTLSQ